MGTYKEIYGNLIRLAQQGEFDAVCHGCNAFCTQGSGLAPQMVSAFGTDKFVKEQSIYRGDINKLGTIDYEIKQICIPNEPDFIEQYLAVIILILL